MPGDDPKRPDSGSRPAHRTVAVPDVRHTEHLLTLDGDAGLGVRVGLPTR